MKGIKLRVNEIFYSVQGEGGNTGMAAVFVRLSGCNLSCPFCDTEYEAYREMSLAEVAAEVGRYPCRNIIWTGGEPTLQLTEEMITYFKGYCHLIETNGSRRVPLGIDYVSCSAKVSPDVLRVNFSEVRGSGVCVEELRIPIRGGDALPEIGTLPVAGRYYVSPIDVSKENVAYCLELIQRDPRWRLSVQVHKLLGIQ